MFNKVPEMKLKVQGLIFDGNVETIQEQAECAVWEYGALNTFRKAALARGAEDFTALSARLEALDFGHEVTSGCAAARGYFWWKVQQMLDARYIGL